MKQRWNGHQVYTEVLKIMDTLLLHYQYRHRLLSVLTLQ